ncbi:phycobilisome linker polypeptide [Picosynechococcus sp. PCC 7003]|uniref:phycobilisome linker polypeptide n=1 Tax=Picosynechococcus sp. PCC 7003 TaxID=374981 RepID=UPI000810E801|nr:phycobilisome linker polypeptide [Picosynechococcus sp. PCC 7003]ANV84893.1 phycobilisome linker polypeptide [Picosynechococcus sp. PCC 7003]
MLSQFANGTEAASRVFTYEVQGLRQTEETDNQEYAFRRSGSVFINVPYARMNDEMQRILRLGGKIVSIKPYDGGTAAAAEAE